MEQRKKWKKGTVLFGIAALILLVVGLLVGPSITSGSKPAPAATPVASTADCNDPQAVANMLMAQGFKAGQFTVGEQTFNLKLPAAESAATGKFSSKPVNTAEEMVSFLQTGTPAANALLQQVTAQSGATQAEALTPSNWTGFQVDVPSNWSGNTSFVNGHVVTAGTRKDPAGDIGWVLIAPEKCQQVLASSTSTTMPAVGLARGGCGNHELVMPTPPGAPAPSSPAPAPQTPTTPSCVSTSTSTNSCTPTTLPPCVVLTCLAKTNQPPQDNGLVPPSDVSPTPGATTAPATSPPPPAGAGTGSNQGLPSTSGGNDTGSGTGSGTAGGTTCQPTSGCSSSSQTGGGGPTNPVGSGDGNGTQGGTSGGTSSTGGGTISNPFG